MAAQQYVTMGNKAEQLRDELNALYSTSKSGTTWVDFIRNQGNTLYAEIYNPGAGPVKACILRGP